MLVKSSYNDSQVMYWEPAKYVAKLRRREDRHESAPVPDRHGSRRPRRKERTLQPAARDSVRLRVPGLAARSREGDAAAGVDIDAQERGARPRQEARARRPSLPGCSPTSAASADCSGPTSPGCPSRSSSPRPTASAPSSRSPAMMGDYSTVGRDLVNHCVNDILVQGAGRSSSSTTSRRASSTRTVVELVSRGSPQGCRENGCALLGGETAEMPGFYQPGDYELVGFIVGVVDRHAGPRRLAASRRATSLVGLPRRACTPTATRSPGASSSTSSASTAEDRAPWAKSGSGRRGRCWRPTSPICKPLRPLLGASGAPRLAHITGGGLTDNLPRILPRDTHAEIRLGAGRSPSSSAPRRSRARSRPRRCCASSTWGSAWCGGRARGPGRHPRGAAQGRAARRGHRPHRRGGLGRRLRPGPLEKDTARSEGRAAIDPPGHPALRARQQLPGLQRPSRAASCRRRSRWW